MGPGVTAPYSTVVADPSVSPGLAFALGLIIPGVGAIYNGQYAKGLVHVLILSLLFMAAQSSSGLEPMISSRSQ